MDQLILEQASAATERLAKALAIKPDSQNDCDYLEGYNKGYQHGAEWQKEQCNWISVNDRLPDKSGRYLIWFPERSTSIMDAIWNVHEKTWGRDFDRTEYVTHWMPLPSPPQDNTK